MNWLNVGLCAVLFLCAVPASSQAPPPPVRESSGIVNGQVTDGAGAAVAGAKVTLAQEGTSASIETVSGADGRFSCLNVPAGPFRLTVSAPGFAAQTRSGVVAAGEISNLAPIGLTLNLGTIGVDVTPTRVELADQQIKEQEQQRLLGVFPNFRVSYRADAVPLNSRQKFQLTWKSITDPARFVTVGVIAGIQHARNDFSGFGRGAEGYARRYAAMYATAFTATMISNAVLPSLLRQDPRYFHNGTGSKTSRAVYAISRAVVRKADNGRWQPDYSRLLGALASGALSNLYYPAEDRRSARLSLENAAIGVGGAAVGNLFQEFLFKRLTTRSHKASGGQPTSKGANGPR